MMLPEPVFRPLNTYAKGLDHDRARVYIGQRCLPGTCPYCEERKRRDDLHAESGEPRER